MVSATSGTEIAEGPSEKANPVRPDWAVKATPMMVTAGSVTQARAVSKMD